MFIVITNKETNDDVKHYHERPETPRGLCSVRSCGEQSQSLCGVGVGVDGGGVGVGVGVGVDEGGVFKQIF